MSEPPSIPARARLLEMLAERICAIERAHPLRVGLDGIDAAGKTTLADELAAVIERCGRAVIRASIDDFQRPRHQRYARGLLAPEGYYHDSFDIHVLLDLLLLPLGPGGDRRYRTRAFDLRADRPVAAPAQVAPPDAILVLDGVFLQRPELAAHWEQVIFVDVSFDEAQRRAIRRDSALFGSAEITGERYLQRYFPAQRLYFDQCRPRERAQLVVDNNDPDRPRLIEHAG